MKTYLNMIRTNYLKLSKIEKLINWISIILSLIIIIMGIYGFNDKVIMTIFAAYFFVNSFIEFKRNKGYVNCKCKLDTHGRMGAGILGSVNFVQECLE